MTESTKINKGTFTGSYTAPKKRQWKKWTLIIVAILLVLSATGWFVWRSEMSKRLDKETYESALKSSEDMQPLYLDATQRNARFQKYTGITMDAYLENPRTIKSPNDQYGAAELLASGSYYPESAVLYSEIMTNGTLPSEVEATVFYSEAGQVARWADNSELAKRARTGFSEAIMNTEGMDEEMKTYLIENYDDENN